MREVLLILLSLLLLGGCVSNPSYPPGRLSGPVTLPQYHVGDTFLFSDGTIEKVVAVYGDRVDWESRGGDFRYSTYSNFILPKRSWETQKRKVTVQYNSDPKRYWPLQEGESGYLSTIVAVSNSPYSNAKSYLQSWRCAVGGIYQLVVAAGQFDAQKIECRRTTLMGRWMQTRTWYYAPAVGHYILQQDEYAPTSSRTHTKRHRELLAVIPSDVQLTTRGESSPEHHFQKVLDTVESGESSEWRDESDRYSRTITLLRSFKTADSRYCREYQLLRRDDGRTMEYQGTACRGEDRRWRVAVARPDQGQGRAQ